MAQLEFGIVYNRHWSDGIPLKEFAELGEQFGFDALWCSENTFSPLPKIAPLEALTAFALLTSMPRIGTLVLRAPLYNPILLAKACATIDILSGGRLTLGVGVGGENQQEFSASGIPTKERGRRLDETLEVMRVLWTVREAAYSGGFFQFQGVVMEPKPVQPGGPPVWIGGRSPASMDRAVKLGDGWVPHFATPARYARSVETLKELCQRRGRSATSLRFGLLQYISIGEPGPAKSAATEHLAKMYHLTEEQVDRYCIYGPPAQCVERLRAFVDVGVEHFAFAFPCPGEQIPAQIEMLATHITPHLLHGSQACSDDH